ncbi:MAG: DUF1294 domain-containing protein [Clostridium sp.]
MLEYFIYYLIGINLVSFISMYIDKKRAINHKWRISEQSLLLLAIIGGSIGIYGGMQFFRHKTKHIKFTIGLPAILITQVVLLFYVTIKL